MPARERVCRNCRRLTAKNVCENCGSSNLTSNFTGLIIIFDSERSEIAKELGLKNGAYAIRVA